MTDIPLTPEYQERIRTLLAEFRRSAATLNDHLDALDAVDYLRLMIAPPESALSLGLTDSEFEFLMSQGEPESPPWIRRC